MRISKRFHSLFFTCLLLPIVAHANEEPKKEPTVTITTSYQWSRAWKPFAGALLGGIIFAGIPAIAAMFDKKGVLPVQVQPTDFLKVAAGYGAWFGLFSIPLTCERLVCYKCRKEVKDAASTALARLIGMPLLGALVGASLYAIAQHNSYPYKIPSHFTLEDAIKLSGFAGAYAGFSCGASSMQYSVCSECREEL